MAIIKAYGAHPMVALNPATPIIILEDVINDADSILLMTVNPGFAEQRLVEQTLAKIKRLRVWLKSIGSEEQKTEMKANCPEIDEKYLSLLQRAVPAIALPSFTALNNAFCNDVEPELVFAQGLMGIGKKE